ncbi:hypothetical protein [Lysobacter silvisoli]|uniref:Uncharacterized protein n=1 Tax=Lysobacter silvisoli TaxID=2293254 RepID=A0A371JX42_9GAMM|nr:hypothetical protein [Lysobacter silvisoli]RDZ26167.1 hypothetical protein DX914_18005 [Lysobacter silvisoli]
MKPAVMVSIGLLLAACAGTAEHQTPLPYLPREAPPPPGTVGIALTAGYVGRLLVERGCVKLDGGRRRTTMLWTPGTTIGRDARGLFLRESHAGGVVRFGAKIHIGGGELPEQFVARAYPEVVQRCGGPYAQGWISD